MIVLSWRCQLQVERGCIELENEMTRWQAVLNMKTALIRALSADLEDALAKYHHKCDQVEDLAAEVLEQQRVIEALEARVIRGQWWYHLDKERESSGYGPGAQLHVPCTTLVQSDVDVSVSDKK